MSEQTTTTPVKNEPEQAPREFRPAVDVIENGERVRLSLDMPGVAESDLEITLEENELTISGRQAPCEAAGHQAVRTEYLTGVFRRTFETSQVIDPDGIRAQLRNGVLTVELAKRKEALPRKILVNAG
jgi:HSP20 family protein